MKRRIEPALLISLALHLVLGAVLVHIVIDSRPFGFDWARPTPEPAGERLTFLESLAGTPPRPVEGAAPGRVDGDSRPPGPDPVLPPAPVTEPPPLPPGAGAAAPPAGGGRGVAGAGGAPGQASTRPAYADPRIWKAPPVRPLPPPGPVDDLRSDLSRALRAHQDSMAVVAGQRRPEDWTFERGGQKWGLDPSTIHLGPIKLPTILLALIPVSAQANPNLTEYERRMGPMAAESRERGPVEVDFRDEVRRIRERVERERAARRDTIRTRPPGGG